MLWNWWPEIAASNRVRSAVLDRLFTVVDAAELDEDRVRDWVVVRQLVNVLWGLEFPDPDQDWLTRSIVIAKAAQRG